MSYHFSQDSECEYFPCHNILETEKARFNCRFCFCPLYHLYDCGGDFTLTDKGIKDCSCCTFPHCNYDLIISRIIKESEK